MPNDDKYNLMSEVSASPWPIMWPIPGILFGPYERILVSLPTQLNTSERKNTIYLVDLNASISTLSPHIYGTLGIPITHTSNANINGFQCHVHPGQPGQISTLGMDYFSCYGDTLIISYKAKTITIDLEQKKSKSNNDEVPPL